MGVSIPFWAALAASAAGAGINMYNQKQTNDKRQNILAQEIRKTLGTQKTVGDQTNQLLSKMAQSSPAAARASTDAAFMAALQKNAGNSSSAFSAPSTASGAFGTSANKARQGALNVGTTQAGQLAGMVAPGLQRQAEGQVLQHYIEALQPLRRKSRQNRFLTQMELQATHPDPFLSALSSLASGFGAGWKGDTKGKYGRLLDKKLLSNSGSSAFDSSSYFGPLLNAQNYWPVA